MQQWGLPTGSVYSVNHSFTHSFLHLLIQQTCIEYYVRPRTVRVPDLEEPRSREGVGHLEITVYTVRPTAPSHCLIRPSEEKRDKKRSEDLSHSFCLNLLDCKRHRGEKVLFPQEGKFLAVEEGRWKELKFFLKFLKYWSCHVYASGSAFWLKV